MKLLHSILLFTAVAVNATSTQRLRLGTEKHEVNTRYLDLATHVDNETKLRVARQRRLEKDVHTEHKERQLINRELQSSMSMLSMSMSMRLEEGEDMSLSMSMMSMSMRIEDPSMSLSMSMSM